MFIEVKMSRRTKIALTACAIVIIVASILFFIYYKGYSGIHKHTEAKEGQIKVACIGDSVTYGFGINGWAKNNYPSQLAEILGEKYHVENFGHSGRTLSNKGDKPYSESKQYELSLEYNADIVVIMLGSNDSKPKNWNGELNFIEEYAAFIEKYKEKNPNVEIIICTPPKAFFLKGNNKNGETKFDIRPDVLESIRNELRSFALVNGYKCVDIYSVTEYHSEWFSDGVHPSAEGASAIAEAIADKIKN
jgi:lysophospholipase L1-like esterase